MATKEEIIGSLVKILYGDESPGSTRVEVKEDPKVEVKEEPKDKEEPKNKEEPKSEEENEEVKVKVEAKEENKAEAEKLNKLARQNVDGQIKNALANAGVDSELAEKAMGFLDYDKLINDDYDIDEEKVKELSESLAGLASRVPPKSKKRHDRTDDSFGKYLNKD